MKGANMRTPVLNEIFQQKLLYNSHLKKLQKIRQQRKNQLAYDSYRIAKFQQIKHNKSKSFAHRYNQQHHEINQSNIKLLNKLQKVKPFNRYTIYTSYQKQQNRQNLTMTPFKKRRLVQTQKQNSRIYMKVKSASSNLSKDKLLKDYAKSQQIKSRIARYATQNNKVCLKSQKFLNLSHDKINLAAHYNPQQVIKNKIISPTEQFKNKANKTRNDTTTQHDKNKQKIYSLRHSLKIQKSQDHLPTTRKFIYDVQDKMIQQFSLFIDINIIIYCLKFRYLIYIIKQFQHIITIFQPPQHAILNPIKINILPLKLKVIIKIFHSKMLHKQQNDLIIIFKYTRRINYQQCIYKYESKQIRCLEIQIYIKTLEKKNKDNQAQIGQIKINLIENDNYKLRRVKMQSNIYKNAFIQTFVLIFPIHSTQNNIRSSLSDRSQSFYISNSIINQSQSNNQQKDTPAISLIHIDYNEDQDLYCKPRTNNNILYPQASKKCSITSNSSIQTHNLQSLLTLNKILEEQNIELQGYLDKQRQKNNKLQIDIYTMELKMQQLVMKIQDLQATLQQSVDKIDVKTQRAQQSILLYKLREDQILIQQLNNKMTQFQRQNNEKTMIIQTLNSKLLITDQILSKTKLQLQEQTKKCSQLQISLIQTKKSTQLSNKAYSIDQIVSQLSKYSQTVKKCKNSDKNYGSQSNLNDNLLKSSRKKSQINIKPINFIKSLNKKDNKNMIQNKQRCNNLDTTYSLTSRQYKYA